MSSFLSFVSQTSDHALDQGMVEEASDCLDRFTQAFNALDLPGMDAQLHFPHVMISASDTLIWEAPGQHPPDFFQRLQSTGWACTRYESKLAVLTGQDKVHFLVTYTRRSGSGEELSRHSNLWIVVHKGGRWGVALRSY